MLTDLFITFLLILVNGFFAMAELALLSAKQVYLQQQAKAGSKGARIALDLIHHPSRFLSTVQIGITLIGIGAGAYSGATLAKPLEECLTSLNWLTPYQAELAFAIVIAITSYVSLVVGELVPKQIALNYSVPIACFVAPFMLYFSKAFTPFVYLLDISNRVLLKLMGLRRNTRAFVSEDEIKAIIAEGGASGALDMDEQRMLERIIRLDDQSIRSIMTPRNNIIWLDIHESFESVLQKIAHTRHARFVVCQHSLEQILGIVNVKDLIKPLQNKESFSLQPYIYQPLFLPDSSTIRTFLDQLKQTTANMALVIDEYGSLEGLVTLKDVLEGIVGILPEPVNRNTPQAIRREDGSWLFDGMLSIHSIEEFLRCPPMSDLDETYTTLAGFLLFHLGHVPQEAEFIEWEGYKFEVIDMDGRRIDKVLVSPFTSDIP